MRRVHVLVEGQTEELFVNAALQPALPGLSLNAVVIATKRVKAGGKFRGGLSSFKQVADDARRLLSDSSAAAVTTLFDLYGLPDDFPGASSALRGRERATHLEAEMHRALSSQTRLIPHLSVHEFEAFLFVNPARAPTVFNPEQQRQLSQIAGAYAGDVELINDGAATHPSARVRAIAPGYDKVLGGSIAVLETGLDGIMKVCPHFRAWVERLAAL